jgi:hypothetical protein
MCEGLDFTCDDLTSEALLRCDEFRINNTYIIRFGFGIIQFGFESNKLWTIETNI